MRRVSTALPADPIDANFRLRLGLSLAFVVSALALMGALLALAPTASAAKETIATIGAGAGAGGDQFSQPRGIAVNQSGNGAPAGTFYVVDGTGNRVQQFSPSGAFVRAWGWGVRNGEAEFEVCAVSAKCLKGTAGNNAGQLNNALGIAVDQNTGNVYVANSGSRRISVYKATGIFMGAFGWGALNSAPSLQFCTMATGCAAPGPTAPTSGNVGGGQFGSTIGGLATDAEGNLYVANRTSRRVDVFKPQLTGSAVTGVEWLRSFGWGAATGAAEFQVCTVSPCKAAAAPGTGAGQFGANSPSDLTVDAGGSIYALDVANKRVQKFSSAPVPLDSAFGATALSTTFGSGSLIAVKVDPETGHVFVAGNRASSANRVAVQELDELGGAVETHGTGLTVNGAVGLAVASHSNGGTLYLSSSADFLQRILVLNDPALKPAIDPVAGVSATEATFSGEVVSDEVDTAYRFEYSTDGFNWVKGAEETVPAQPGAATVQETVTGLLPNMEYRVRLSSNRPSGSWTTTSSVVTFTTSAQAPTVAGGMATQVTDTSARLVAYLNPNNAATTYQFEYGTTEAYGSVFPVPAASAGEGGEQVTVSQVVSGLTPNTTYHFRAVAENPAGEEAGPDLTFTTGSISPVLTSRAYELVTPPVSNGQDVSTSTTNVETTTSPDGESVLYLTWGPLPGSKAGGFIVSNLASRGAEGWTNQSLSPIQNPDPLGGSLVQYGSEDFSKIALQGPLTPQAAPGGGEGTTNLFHLDPATDVYKTISVGTAASDENMAVQVIGASNDLDKVYFEYVGAASLAEGSEPNERQLYLWDESDQSVEIVGRAPGTEAPILGQVRIGSFRYNNNTVSADGSRIFFWARNGEERRVYVRIDGSETKELSASQRTIPDPNPGDAFFRYASDDGSVAFFTSNKKLTDDATTGPESLGSDLYRYDIETGELTDITVDPSSENGAEVIGFLAGAEDGSRIYFVARGVLAPGAEAGASNVYMWTDDGSAKGSIEFVAHDVAESNFTLPGFPSGKSAARSTPDGSMLLFSSTHSLTDYPTNGFLQGYLFDAASGDLRCVTCNPMGGPITANAEPVGTGDLIRMARTLSDDGRRVFFTSPERLVPEDEDGGKDAYEYETGSGRLTLLSSGQSSESSVFQDASADGRDVFIATRDALVSVDRNETMDVYDARIGGGFASQNPPPPPPPCDPGECQTPTPAAPPPVPGSAVVQGPGNQVQKGKRAQKPKRCKKPRKGKKKRGKRCAGKAGNQHGQR